MQVVNTPKLKIKTVIRKGLVIFQNACWLTTIISLVSLNPSGTDTRPSQTLKVKQATINTFGRKKNSD